jgi:hypothetical protein
MENQQQALVDLEKLASLMAQALPDLDCPECCGPVHQFIEFGAHVYQEQREWAYFAWLLQCHCKAKR